MNLLATMILAVAIGGVAPLNNEGSPIAPTSIAVGRQEVQLRHPLHARAPGARLVLFVREMNTSDGNGGDALAAFKAAIPLGSVVAHLDGARAEPLTLEHTDYVFNNGKFGIVLGDTANPRYGELYDQLEIESTVALPQVRFVWLDRGSKRVSGPTR